MPLSRASRPAMGAHAFALFFLTMVPACAGPAATSGVPAPAPDPLPASPQTAPAPIAEPPTAPSDNKLRDQVARLLSGRFDSSRQASTTPGYIAVQLDVCPVSAPELGEAVLYVEQALVQMWERPYRQRLYVLEQTGPDTVVSHIYSFRAPQAVIGLCQRWPKPLLTAALVEERVGCAVHLKKDGERFVGSTQGKSCPSDLRGATYATSEVTLGDGVLESWDRGYSADSAQVWGATDGAYRFERVPVAVEEADPAVQIDQVLAWMEGSFDNSAQVAADAKNFAAATYRACRVQRKDSPNERLLLVEQRVGQSGQLGQPGQPEKPKQPAGEQTRRAVYRFVPGAKGMIVVSAHPVRTAKALANLCDSPQSEPRITIDPKTVAWQTTCQSYMRHAGGGRYLASTQAGGCPSTEPGSEVFHGSLVIEDGTVAVWDRWHGKDGAQVAGSKAGPYLYRRAGTP